ncbi:MAG TPA: O-antigen ligase family protein [Thermoleophilaceae bacterium]
MATPLAVGVAAKEAGMIVAALAVAGAFFVPSARGRAVCVLVALVLTPVLLVGELWDSSQFVSIRDHPAPAVGAAVLGVAVMGALAAVFLRRPEAFPLLAVFTLPFRIPVEAGGQTANLLVPLYAVVGGAAIAYAWERLRGSNGGWNGQARRPFCPDERPPGTLEAVLIGAVVLYTLQAAYSTDFETALKNVVFFYVPFALLFRFLTSLEWNERVVRRAFGVALLLALVFVSIGFWEYATRHLLWNPKVIASNEFESYFRVNSLFFDPSIYGRFLALVMIGLATVLLWARRTRNVWVVTGLLAFLWAGLVLTFSQSSFVALLVGLAVLAALRWRARPVVATVAAAAIVAAIVVVAVPSAVNLDVGSSRSVSQASSGRFDLIGGGLRMFADRPVWGFGSGSFSKEFRQREKVSSQRAASASHTIPLTYAAEQGVVGFAAYVAVLWAAFRLLFRSLSGPLRGREPPGDKALARAAIAAAFAALVVHTLLYASFLEDPITWTLLGAGLALQRRPRRVRTGAAAATASEQVPAEPAAG